MLFKNNDLGQDPLAFRQDAAENGARAFDGAAVYTAFQAQVARNKERADRDGVLFRARNGREDNGKYAHFFGACDVDT